MITATSVEDIRKVVNEVKHKNEEIAFVPTMGYLHEGHLSLVRLARAKGAKVFVSIFVNPTQFNDAADFEKYPIDIKKDSALLEQEGVHAIFIPTVETIYGKGYKFGAPDEENAKNGGYQSWVNISDLTLDHEGACRPGHFRGVTTVVSILFNLVQPDYAIFGEKDFQQMRIIEQMVSDLKWNMEIVRGPLIREADGLALSSRNVRLDKEAREAALNISKGLFEAKALYIAGERKSATLIDCVQKRLTLSALIKPEYVKVIEEKGLKPVSTIDDQARIIVAVSVGKVRLIDNVGL